MISIWTITGAYGATGEELLVAFDKARAMRVLICPAWFDEANKLRRFTVEVMRRLDKAGIDSFLPDLPGCNDSLAPLAPQTLASWKAGMASAAYFFKATHVLTIRAGALLAPDHLPGWLYAPQSGNKVLRGMIRARTIAAREAGREEKADALLALGRSEGLVLGGWSLGPSMIRSGAFGGQAELAARIARAGFPVFRFDRRGIGDSEGENRGFRHSAKDIAAAIEAFRAMAPQIERVVAFGKCDAASALMLAGGAGCDALVLSNPWTIEQDESAAEPDATPPPAAICARYAEKLKNPREIARLLGGGVDLGKLVRGLVQSLRPAPPPSSLAQDMRAGLSGFGGDVRILIATADRTAQVFEAAWDKHDPRIRRCEGAGHAYVEPEHRDWLKAEMLAALRA